MPRSTEPIIGFCINPVDAPGADDDRLYRGAIEDAKFGYALGYEVAYCVEHHFSDYFPIPNPLLLFARIAPECPGLGFGTMVLVTPWHQPLRLAEEIAMLSVVCEGPLHLGLGRGNAVREYGGFDVDMEESLERYAETWEILRLAMTGEPFTYSGKYLRVPTEVRIRPTPHRERIRFYGAIANPDSAERIAALGLAPMSNGFLPFETHKKVMAAWDAKTLELGGSTDVGRPVVVSVVMADTDAEARDLAREYLPRFFRAAVKHYDVTDNPYRNSKAFAAHAKMSENFIKLSDPANLRPYMDVTFVGGAATVRQRVQDYLDCGFDNLMVQPSSPGIPQPLRHDWLRRFATEVAPEFSSRFRASGERHS